MLKNKNIFNIYLLFLFILIWIVIALIIFIFCYFKKPRKSRIYELDDDNYDYIPTNYLL